MPRKKKQSQQPKSDLSFDVVEHVGYVTLYRDDKILLLKVYPIDYIEAARIADKLANKEIGFKDLFKMMLPRLKDLVELDDKSEVEIDIEQLSDPTANPLKFAELRDIIMEILTLSGTFPRTTEPLIKPKVIGKIDISVKPLGVIEAAEIIDIIADEKHRNENIVTFTLRSIKEYVDFETDLNITKAHLASSNPRVNPLTPEQLASIFNVMLEKSGVFDESFQ